MGAPRATPLSTTPSPLTIKSFQLDINNDGRIGIFTQFFGQNWRLLFINTIDVYFWSDDDGATWDCHTPTVSIECGDGDFTDCIDISEVPQTPYSWANLHEDQQIGDLGAGGSVGGTYAYCPLGRGALTGSFFWFSDRSGKANWTKLFDHSTFDCTFAVFNTDVYQTACYFLGFGTGTKLFFKRSTDHGLTWSANLLPATFAAATYNSRPSEIYRFHALWNPSGTYANTLRLVSDNRSIWKSTDAGVSWTNTTPDTDLATYCTELGISLCHDADGKLYGIKIDGSTTAGRRAIMVSDDEGATWEAKAGPDPDTPDSDSIPNEARVIYILQVWA